jgi:hypothetical protein
MSNSDENRILLALKQAKQQGQLRVEKIREIVRNAVMQTIAEEKEGRKEISSLMQDAVSATIEVFQEKGGEIKEEITASIEGAIEGIESIKGQRNCQDRLKIQELESKIDAARSELQQEINGALVHLKQTQTGRSEKVKLSVEAAINNVLNSEEVALLQKRYAQLKAQLAIVQATLTAKYGGSFEDIKHHLDDTKNWYEKAKKDPEVFTNTVDKQRIEFENKLGEAGVAIAQKEQQIKQVLQELWKSMTSLFQDKKSK